MELNVDKIKAEFKRLGWSYERAANEMGLKNRQSVYEYFRTKSLKSAVKFAKVLKVDPKDLIK